MIKDSGFFLDMKVIRSFVNTAIFSQSGLIPSYKSLPFRHCECAENNARGAGFFPSGYQLNCFLKRRRNFR